MKVYFIGIGGIGVSALAQYYLSQGEEVFGSDLAHSEIIDFLREKGAKIFIGEQHKENLSQDFNLVIYSPAVQKDNPELEEAFRIQSLNPKLEIKSYPQILGHLTKDYFTIAVSGAHGKSTTSSMISLLLVKAGLNPTVIIGTKLKEFGDTNFRLGDWVQYQGQKLRFLVIEADEYEASFLNYWPQIIVLTNIEPEHLDYYKKEENIFRAFRDYIGHLSKDGYLVLNADDYNSEKVTQGFEKIDFQIKKYSLGQPEAKMIKNLLQIPGEYNVSNALATLSVGRILGIQDQVSFLALSEYKGAWRRFQIQAVTIKNKAVILVSDYAHHPTEIKVTLQAAREKWPNKRIWVVFQPHQYQRTYYFFDRLVEVFSLAPIQNLILMPIYAVAGREDLSIQEKVSSEKLSSAIKDTINKKDTDSLDKKVLCLNNVSEARDYLEQNIQTDDILIIMGAGDIYELSKSFPLDHKK